MNSVLRISAIAMKEWQLNLRFPLQFFVNHLIGPVKTAILLSLLYAGLLRSGESNFGHLSYNNYQLYVLLGTICHTLFSSGCGLFMSKFSQEKWWQTLTGTLISPASPIEMNVGFVMGSGILYLFSAVVFLISVSIFNQASLASFVAGLGVLGVLSLYAFGLSLVGGTLLLCFEGRTFFYDHSVQILIFMSCFYYPPEILPNRVKIIASYLPTFQLGILMKQAYLGAITAEWLMNLGWLAVGGCVMFVVPSLFYQWAIKRFGIVGY